MAAGIQNVPLCVYFFLVNTLGLPLLLLLQIILYPWQIISSVLFSRGDGEETQRLTPAFGAVVKEAKTDHTLDTVVLLHGFPDDLSLWDDTVSFLTTHGYRCVLVSFPGCNGEDVPHPPELLDLPRQVMAAVDRVTTGETSSQSFTFLGHDYGSFIAGQIRKQFPQRVHRLIQVDLGEFLDLSASRYTLLCSFSYQVGLYVVFGMRHPVGTAVFRAGGRLMPGFFGKMPRPLSQFRSDMAWMYQSFYRELFSLRGVREFSLHGTAETPNKIDEDDNGTDFERDWRGLKSLPHLFVYGKKKIFHFHDEDFLRYVQRCPGGNVHELDGGHWIMNDDRERWCNVVLEWLTQSSELIVKTE